MLPHHSVMMCFDLFGGSGANMVSKQSKNSLVATYLLILHEEPIFIKKLDISLMLFVSPIRLLNQ